MLACCYWLDSWEQIIVEFEHNIIIFIQLFEYIVCKMLTILCQPRCVKYLQATDTVCPIKYEHSFVVLCFVVVISLVLSRSMWLIYRNPSRLLHWHWGNLLPQCQWSNHEGYGQNPLLINHNKAQQRVNHAVMSWEILYVRGYVQENIVCKRPFCQNAMGTKDTGHVLFNMCSDTSRVNYHKRNITKAKCCKKIVTCFRYVRMPCIC